VRMPDGYRLRTISDTSPRLALAFPVDWSARPLRAADVRFQGTLQTFAGSTRARDTPGSPFPSRRVSARTSALSTPPRGRCKSTRNVG
jgi:hypothetical protein